MEYHFQFLMNPELLDLKPLFAGASTSVPPGVSTHNPANCVSIYYIWSGKGMLYRDEQAFPIAQGQAFLIPPGQTIAWKSSKQDPLQYQWIGFAGALSHRFLELPTVFDVPDGVFSRLESVNAVSTHTEYLLTSELFKLFYLLLQPKREPRNYVQKVADRIQSSYMEKLRIEDLAKEFRLDRSYLNRQFKKATGYSIKEYLTHVRLERAVWHLARGYNVKETALLCGFNDVSNFSRAFKQQHSSNMSPQQWQIHIRRVHKEKSLLTKSFDEETETTR